jgi:hypothetical protein
VKVVKNEPTDESYELDDFQVILQLLSINLCLQFCLFDNMLTR